MTQPHAGSSGRFSIGGDIEVTRLGFGAMRLTGPGIWGPPKNRAEAIDVLKRLPDLGIDFIDTSDAYGPAVNEEYIAEALHPYDNLLIATKGGLTRPGPDIWESLGRPDYLRQCVQNSLRRLKVERIDLWQLHRIDPEVPRDDQFGVMADMQKEGLIRHVGLSQVSVEDIVAARRVLTVATVQNRYNLADRTDEAVLEYCAAHGIGFIPWYPLAAGDLAKPGGKLAAVAKAHGATSSQIALAWILQRSPVMLPIPGTSQLAHLEENVAAADIHLSDREFQQLDDASPKPKR